MILKIVASSIAITLLATLLKSDFKTGATLLSFAGCILIFSISFRQLSDITSAFEQIGLADGVNSECVGIIIKILAVSYITGFGADICSDAGEKAIANAVECIGKVTMVSLSFPMLTAIFETISDMIG